MNTLIVYTTRYGCTEKCANILSEKLKGKVELWNLKGGKPPELSRYDKIIIGGSIYMGKIQKEIKDFCTNNLALLQEKILGLYICCMRDGEVAEEELKGSFPQELLARSAAKDYFGGEFKFAGMRRMDKFIAKKVAKVNEDVSTVSEEKIDRFAQAMNSI